MMTYKHVLSGAGLAQVAIAIMTSGCGNESGGLADFLAGRPIEYKLSVELNGEGAVGIEPPGTAFESGTEVTLTATPAGGSRFVGWEMDEQSTQDTGPREDPMLSISVDRDLVVTAVFVAQHTLTATPLGEGNVEPAEGTFDEGAEVVLVATPADGCRFVGWQLEGDPEIRDAENPELALTIDEDKQVTAVFVAQHTLATEVHGGGTIEPSEGVYDEGQEIALTATADRGFRFAGWESTGELSLADASDPELLLTMADDTVITAVFLAQYTVTTAVSGNGVVEPEGGTYDEGVSLNLTAISDDGFAFDRWEGDVPSAGQETNPLTVTADQDVSVTAVFVPLYDVVVDVEGEGAVDTRAATLKEGTMLTLTATPGNGSTFAYWSGDASGTQNPLTVIVEGDLAITAVFADLPTLTVGSQGQGRVSPSGGQFEEGTWVSLTATADTWYVFDQWLGDVPPGQTESNPLHIEMVQDRSLTAVFMPGIRPGLGLDRVDLGDSVDRVKQRVGQPDEVMPDPTYWVNYLLYEALGIAVAIEDSNQNWSADNYEPAVLIFAMTPFSGAHLGLSIGSPWDQVEQTMGPPEGIDLPYYWYCTQGIGWTVENAIVTEVAVMEPFACANTAAKSTAAARVKENTQGHMFRGAKAALTRAE